MTFEGFIAELGKRMGVESGAAANPGLLYRITLPTGTEITLENLDSGKQIALSALFCRYPSDEERLALFDRLMEAHAFGLATDGAYFAASARAGKVVMTKVLDLDDTHSFEALLSDLDGFVGQLQAWKAEYDAGHWSQSGVPGSDNLNASGQQFA